MYLQLQLPHIPEILHPLSTVTVPEKSIPSHCKHLQSIWRTTEVSVQGWRVSAVALATSGDQGPPPVKTRPESQTNLKEVQYY